MDAPEASSEQPPLKEQPAPREQRPSQEQPAQEENKYIKCIACRREIPEGATLCPHCKSYQRSWRNSVQYIGVAVALITISNFIVGGLQKAYDYLKWKDSVELVYLKSPAELAVLNNGNRIVFLENVAVESPSLRYESRMRINTVLDQNEFLALKVPGGTQASQGQYLKKWPGDKVKGTPRGYVPVFFLADDPELALLKANLGPALPLFPGKATLTYRSARNGRRRTSFKVTGLLVMPATVQSAVAGDTLHP